MQELNLIQKCSNIKSVFRACSPDARKARSGSRILHRRHRDSVKMKPFVYILKIDKGQYYIGSTSDLQRRLSEHKLGIKSGTRYSKTIELMFSQEFETVSIARKTESKLNRFKNKNIIEKIIAEKFIRTYID